MRSAAFFGSAVSFPIRLPLQAEEVDFPKQAVFALDCNRIWFVFSKRMRSGCCEGQESIRISDNKWVSMSQIANSHGGNRLMSQN
jgi:hypothetical protein